jgi:shikimate kinase
MKNILLIGMAGSGKSTVGLALSRQLGWNFVDIDNVLREKYRKSLPEIIADVGEAAFVALEGDETARYFDIPYYVIAPGGSIVYATSVMEEARRTCTIIYLESEARLIGNRIDPTTRGIIGLKDKTLEQLVDERDKLYVTWADLRVPQGSIEEMVATISAFVSSDTR